MTSAKPSAILSSPLRSVNVDTNSRLWVDAATVVALVAPDGEKLEVAKEVKPCLGEDYYVEFRPLREIATRDGGAVELEVADGQPEVGAVAELAHRGPRPPKFFMEYGHHLGPVGIQV